jgi:hypothetical protein
MPSIHRVLLHISSAVPVWYFGGLKRSQHAQLPKAARPAQRFNPTHARQAVELNNFETDENK